MTPKTTVSTVPTNKPTAPNVDKNAELPSQDRKKSIPSIDRTPLFHPEFVIVFAIHSHEIAMLINAAASSGPIFPALSVSYFEREPKSPP